MPTHLSLLEREVGASRFLECSLSSDSGVNPLSRGVVQALRERLRAIDEAPTPLAVVVRASGRCFCAGADLKEFRAFDEAAFRGYMSEVLALYAQMIELRKPILSVVQADARGGGAALALCSDFVIAASGTRFALPEALRGLAGGGYLMPRLMGRQRAAEMVLLGREFTAEQMHDWGLVNEVCPPDRLEDRTTAWCEEIARIPASAFAVGKTSLAGGLSVGLLEAMQRHVDAQTRAFVSARGAGLV